MREYLESQDALHQEGIFRLAGDSSDMKQIKQSINKSKTFEGVTADINTVANLLKVREQPVKALLISWRCGTGICRRQS